MTESLPHPIVPDYVDLRHVPAMMLDVQRLRDSELSLDPLALGYALLLWCTSWHQVPAASLPDNDRALARAVQLPMAEWMAVREQALHGFIKCSDGRLYHPVVAEKAVEMWEATYKRKQQGSKAAKSRWDRTRDARALLKQSVSNARAMREQSSSNARAMLNDAKGREESKRATDKEKLLLTDSQYSPSARRTQPLVIEKIATSSLKHINSMDAKAARNGAVSVLATVPHSSPGEPVDAIDVEEGHLGSSVVSETIQ